MWTPGEMIIIAIFGFFGNKILFNAHTNCNKLSGMVCFCRRIVHVSSQKLVRISQIIRSAHNKFNLKAMWTILMKIGYSNIYFTPVAFVTFSLDRSAEQEQMQFTWLGIFLSYRKSPRFLNINTMNGCNKFLIDFGSFSLEHFYRCVFFIDVHMKNTDISIRLVRTNCQGVIKKQSNDWTKCEQNHHIKT